MANWQLKASARQVPRARVRVCVGVGVGVSVCVCVCKNLTQFECPCPSPCRSPSAWLMFAQHAVVGFLALPICASHFLSFHFECLARCEVKLNTHAHTYTHRGRERERHITICAVRFVELLVFASSICNLNLCLFSYIHFSYWFTKCQSEYIGCEEKGRAEMRDERR